MAGVLFAVVLLADGTAGDWLLAAGITADVLFLAGADKKPMQPHKRISETPKAARTSVQRTMAPLLWAEFKFVRVSWPEPWFSPGSYFFGRPKE